MRINIRHPFFDFYKLINVETKEEIKDFIYADDKLGEYEIICRDENGDTIIIRDYAGNICGVKQKFMNGKIKLISNQFDE